MPVELARVVEAWPRLTADERAAIMAAVVGAAATADVEAVEGAEAGSVEAVEPIAAEGTGAAGRTVGR